MPKIRKDNDKLVKKVEHLAAEETAIFLIHLVDRNMTLDES